jgi:predicted RNase H-like HicB family nuclease
MRRLIKKSNADLLRLLQILRSKNMKRKVILYRGEDGYVIAEIPSLQGVVSQGKTREEALQNIREAASLHIEVLQDRGLIVPQDETEMAEIAV